LVLLGVAASVVVSGCGGGSSTGPVAPPPAAVNTVTGVASKGPLSGATVCAYAISAGAKGTLIGTCAASASTGAYTLDLGSYTGPVLLEATGGSYVDEATGTSVSLATPLRSVLANFAGGSASAAVTALTEVATQLGLAGTGGLNTSNIQNAIAAVQTNFGVADILATQPVDALSVPANASADQKAYALALASLSQYLKGQASGTTLASALQTMQACLASAAGCGSLHSDFGTAMAAFQAGHPDFAGIALASGSFGGDTAGSGTGTETGNGLSCTTAHYQSGAVRLPTSTELANFAKTYSGNTGSFVNGSWVSNGGSASFVISSSGGLSYNGTAQTVNSICADTTIAMLYVEFGGTGEVDFFADGAFTGNLPDLTGVYGGPGSSGGSSSGGSAGTACLVDGSTAQYPNGKVCYASLPVPFTCNAAGMRRSASAYLAVTGATSYAYSTVDSCPTGVTVAQNSTLSTISGTGVASTLSGTAIAATTYAGPEVDGTAANARFYFASTPTLNGSGITSDGSNLFVVDSAHYAIRKVDIASGSVTTLAGTPAGVDYPYGFPGSGFNDGVGTAAYLYGPQGITMDPTHTALYLADGRYVRKIDVATASVSTLAYAAPKTNATFKNASTNATDWFRGAVNVATDGSTLYVLDAAIDAGSSGAMRLLALDLASNQVRNVAVSLPARSQALALDGNLLYVAGGGLVSKIDLATLAITTLAGSSDTISRDGVGTAAAFSLRNEGIASDGANLYITDGALVRQLVLATGVVTTLAGATEGYADGVGDAAQFKLLGGLVRVGTKLYMPDNLSAIRQVQP
jgi:hypothetical protein